MFGLISQPLPNAAQLAYLAFQVEEEKDRQRAIVRAREYYSGHQTTYLSARLKEFLDTDSTISDDELFHLNVCKKIVTALTERLSVSGCTSDEPDGVEDRQGEIVEAWWQNNRLDAQQKGVYRAVLRDGEHFVIVDFQDGQPRLTPHPRYTDPEVQGDGYGCRAHYPAGETSQDMEYASKRWIEDYTTPDGKTAQRQRMTLYYPNRIEKYAMISLRWEPFIALDAEGKQEPWPIPWLDARGDPLGIAVIHFQNEELECEIDSSVISQQNFLNKTQIDLAESLDQYGFPIRTAFGFYLTTDGQPLKTDGSNRARIGPNSVIGHTSKGPGDAAFNVIPPPSLQGLIDAANHIERGIARMKDIPASRFQITGQVAAEGTLKQQEAPMHAKCEQLQITLGDAWEDAFYLARKLVNTYGPPDEFMDELITFDTQWEALDVRADDREDPERFYVAAKAAVDAGVPLKVFLKRNGWTEADLADIPDAVPPANEGGPGLAIGAPPIQDLLAPHIAEFRAAMASNGNGNG